MPAYDYRCLDCRKRFDIFMTYAEYGTKPVKCPHCGSEKVERRIGRVRVARSTDSRMTELADPSQLENMDRDPRTLGRMMRQMSGEIGEDMG
ncbi:zinc ribbon domain-containing protein, partial [bacterium]|nr:zinc ribbon domain-containing protein [bacterium]